MDNIENPYSLNVFNEEIKFKFSLFLSFEILSLPQSPNFLANYFQMN